MQAPKQQQSGIALFGNNFLSLQHNTNKNFAKYGKRISRYAVYPTQHQKIHR